jgi:hypothetical protein
MSWLAPESISLSKRPCRVRRFSLQSSGRSAGYVVHIVYLWLSTAEMAVARVHKRVLQGGHSVPDDVVRRRYERGISNFATRYRKAADRWQLYDNANPLDPRMVAIGVRGVVDVIDIDRWNAFQRAVARATRIREVLMADRPPLPDTHIERWFSDPSNLERAMRIVHAQVIRRHRLLNAPLVVERDGRVEFLDPHTVPMPEGVTEEQMGPVFDCW